MRSVLNTKSVIYIASLLVLMNMLSLNEKCCNAISYLDFRTVRYHTFKSVVTKGGRNKCSHLLFIHQTSSSDKSKLFVGGCMKKNDKSFSEKPLVFLYKPPEGDVLDTENATWRIHILSTAMRQTTMLILY